MPEFYLIDIQQCDDTYVCRVYETKDDYDLGHVFDSFETGKVVTGFDEIGVDDENTA